MTLIVVTGRSSAVSGLGGEAAGLAPSATVHFPAQAGRRTPGGFPLCRRLVGGVVAAAVVTLMVVTGRSFVVRGL